MPPPPPPALLPLTVLLINVSLPAKLVDAAAEAPDDELTQHPKWQHYSPLTTLSISVTAPKFKMPPPPWLVGSSSILNSYPTDPHCDYPILTLKTPLSGRTALIAIDDGSRRAAARDRQIASDRKLSGSGENSEDVSVWRQDDLVGPGQGIGLFNRRPQRGHKGAPGCWDGQTPSPGFVSDWRPTNC